MRVREKREGERKGERKGEREMSKHSDFLVGDTLHRPFTLGCVPLPNISIDLAELRRERKEKI